MKYYHNINLENMYRSRLCHLIDECMKLPVISIEAGPGYGKSVVVNQYLETYKKKYIFMRFNRLDNIPEQFWLKYTSALAKMYPETAEKLRNLGFPFTKSEINNCLHILADSYYDLEEDLCMIMDGFHLLTEPSILYFLEHRLHLEIEYLHTILISAYKHNLNLKSFHQEGLVTEIRKGELSFTKEEIGQYFEQLKIHYDQQLINLVYQFSEGWAFAVKLAAFFVKNNISRNEIPDKALPTILDLMDTYAFENYSQRFKDALIALSFLHTVPIKLVMSVVSLTAAEIQRLSESNPFITYDESAGTIEIHKIYLKLLETKRSFLSKEGRHKYISAIGEWYYSNGYIFDALNFYNQSNNYDRICEIIRKFKNKKLSQDMAHYLLQTIKRLPDEVIECNKDIPLYEALFLFNNYKLEQAQEILRQHEVELLRVKGSKEAKEMLGETYLLLGLVRMFMKEGDYDLYFKWADMKLENGSSMIDYTYPLVEINHGLVCKSLSKEDVDTALKVSKRGFRYFTKITHGCGSGLPELAYGEYEFLRCNLRKSEEYLYQGLYKAEEYLQADIVLVIYFLLFRIGIARGNTDQALEYMDKIKNFNSSGMYPKRDYPLIDIAQGWLSLKMESSMNIANWLISKDDTPNVISKLSQGRNLTMYAHWLLVVKKNPIEAVAYLEKIEKYLVEHNAYTSLVYCYQLKYVAYKMLGRPQEEGFKIIELIYDMIKDCGFFMFVVEHGSSTRSGLLAYKKYKDKKIPDEWIDKAITKSMTYGKYFNMFKMKYQMAMDCLPEFELSDNEKSLLDGLCYGLSRAEIAEENHITENTVKSQLKNIYNKLNAANQAEAVYIYTMMSSTE